MEATATINLQAMTQSNVTHIDRHNNRENDHYSNDQIIADDTELNTHISVHDENVLLERQYGGYIDKRNNKLERDYEAGKISTQQYTSRKQNVQEYINGSNGSKQKKAYTDMVMTVGSVDILPKMLDQMGFTYRIDVVGKDKDKHDRYTLTDSIQRKQWSSFWADVYRRTAKDIDDQMDGMSVVSLDVHMDEGGMPHGHIKGLNSGVTASGKPSTTLNSALKKSYGNKDSRANLKQFRKEYDKRLIDNFNSVAKERGYDINLALVRTGATGHKSMHDYKIGKKHEEDVKNQQDARQEQLDRRAKQQDAQQEQLNRQFLQREVELEYEKTGQDEEYEQRMAKLRQREKELDKREFEKQTAEKEMKEFADMVGVPHAQEDNIFIAIIKYVRNMKNAVLFKNRKRIQERRNQNVINQSRAHIYQKNVSRSDFKSIRHNSDDLEL